MNKKAVGYIILGISAVIGFIIWSFNRALFKIVSTSCSHGEGCPMWGTIAFQTNISIGLLFVIALGGLSFIFYDKLKPMFEKKEEQEPGKQQENAQEIKVQPSKKDFSGITKQLNDEEQKVFQEIIDANGTIFQSNLVDKTEFSKVKVTRILDKLEGRGLVERKRRGMTNVVVLKH